MILHNKTNYKHWLCCLLNPKQIGEHLPSVEVHEGEPGNKVAMDQLFKGKKGVLFAVPGAFTPGCSKVESTLPSLFAVSYA